MFVPMIYVVITSLGPDCGRGPGGGTPGGTQSGKGYRLRSNRRGAVAIATRDDLKKGGSLIIL